jgi:hypothetical protein
MGKKNKAGLNRDIPSPVRRQVRQNSKFGCVICRAGVYHYEHIEPTFANALVHRAGDICCLCASCHDSVHRGQIAKSTIRARYEQMKLADNAQVGSPTGPLDFSGPNARVIFGDLQYAPFVRRVLVYHDKTMLSVLPGYQTGDPGRISAIFTNENGNPTLELRDNRWIGDTSSWDIEVTGPRLTVRNAAGRISLQLELQPPNSIVIARLDMRIADAHILVANGKYVVGRYTNHEKITWVRADLQILRSTLLGAAIEFTLSERLITRDIALRPTSQYMAEPRGEFVMHAAAGAMCMPLGICIGGLTGTFSLRSYACGERSIEDVRQLLLSDPDQITNFLGHAPNGVLYSI